MNNRNVLWSNSMQFITGRKKRGERIKEQNHRLSDNAKGPEDMAKTDKKTFNLLF